MSSENRVYGGWTGRDDKPCYLRLVWARGEKPAFIAGDLYYYFTDHETQIMIKQFVGNWLPAAVLADYLEEHTPNPEQPAFGYILDTLRSQS
jgi:hypothetical protein